MTPELFPLFLKLEGRDCLVVGAGRVAAPKIESLLRCGARVRVVAPEATEAVRGAAEAGAIAWLRRAFRASDLDGAFLVVAATSSPEVQEQIFREARRRGVLCNAVDEPGRCDFYYPAVVRRGPLQIAVSTGGLAPALAQRLRRDLERAFAPEYGAWLEELGRARGELLRSGLSPDDRRAVIAELASQQSFDEFLRRKNATPEAPGSAGEGTSTAGKVYFVGAGPGDPALLTRKAWNLLRDAEVVLHDALVPPAILALAPAAATVLDVGKRCGRKSVTQEEIHALMIAHARSGRAVVRLQGGDPLVFGRAAEEIAALREAGVEFEIVPGVTAASAAAAAAQIALTDRRVASKVIFLSAHRREGRAEPDWGAIPRDATVAIYMPGRDYARIARRLREAGLGPETPCLIASAVSTTRQAVVASDLASLGDVPELPAPALLIVGEVARSQPSPHQPESSLGSLLAATAAT